MVEPTHQDGDHYDVTVPESASPAEAAAIAVAIESYLAEGQEAEPGEAPTWHGRRWTFAGRTEEVSGRAVRVPEGAPADGWTAASRADRF